MIPKLIVFVGICLIGVSSAIWYYVYSCLREVGININWKPDLFPAYRHNRAKHGWPAWPIYAYWPLLIAGFILFAFGAIRL